MPQNNQPEPLEEAAENTNKPRSIFVGNAQWEKARLIRDEIGTWNRFFDVAVEQLLASGLISEETRDAVHDINRKHGIDYLDDTSWRSTLNIREPWPEASSNLRKIEEDLTKINDGIADLAQAVEDHAMAMLEAELVKTYDDPTDGI